MHFSHPFWTSPLPHLRSKLPPNLDPSFLNLVFSESPVPTEGGVSLEGQAAPGGPPDFSDPRQAYALTQIANGTPWDAIFPSKEWKEIDPVLNVTGQFPPTFIVHGEEDDMVPLELSWKLYEVLRREGVRCGMRTAPGEGHTFAARVTVGSRTWEVQKEGFEFLEALLR